MALTGIRLHARVSHNLMADAGLICCRDDSLGSCEVRLIDQQTVFRSELLHYPSAVAAGGERIKTIYGRISWYPEAGWFPREPSLGHK